MKIVLAVAAALTLIGVGVSVGPTPAVARADDGSYLTYIRSHDPGTVAGFTDFALLFGGHKACMTDNVASVAPGFPALSAAVYAAAHLEMCP